MFNKLIKTYFTVYPPDGCDPVALRTHNFEPNHASSVDKRFLASFPNFAWEKGNPFFLALTSFIGWPNGRYRFSGEKLDLIKEFFDYQSPAHRRTGSFTKAHPKLSNYFLKPLFFLPLRLLMIAVSLALNTLKIITEFFPLLILNHCKGIFLALLKGEANLLGEKDMNVFEKFVKALAGLVIGLVGGTLEVLGYLTWFIGRSMTSPVNAFRHALYEAPEDPEVLAAPFKLMMGALSLLSTLATFVFLWPLALNYIALAFPAFLNSIPIFIVKLSAPVFAICSYYGIAHVLAPAGLVGLGLFSALGAYLYTPVEVEFLKPRRDIYFHKLEKIHGISTKAVPVEEADLTAIHGRKPIASFLSPQTASSTAALQAAAIAPALKQKQAVAVAVRCSFKPN
jgi:hypothetical protein